jgi:hypothetical protein
MRIALALVVAAISPLMAAAQPVAPKERVATELLELAAPSLVGWKITQKTPARVTFARAGFGPNGTLAAMAIVFSVESPRSKEHFVELMKAGIAADTPPDRYREVRSELQYEEVRGYPCVRYMAVHEDLGAKTVTAASQPLLMQNHSLYCLHPTQRGAAFVAGYSHRGETLYKELDVSAREFLDEVKPRTR